MTRRVDLERRRFLRLGTGLGLAAGAGSVASMLGCGGSSPTEPGESPRLFLLPCHNLEHEDAGMMLNLEVV